MEENAQMGEKIKTRDKEEMREQVEMKDNLEREKPRVSHKRLSISFLEIRWNQTSPGLRFRQMK